MKSRFWLLAALCCIVGLFILGAQSFAVGVAPPPYDKLLHAMVFGALFVAIDRALFVPLWFALSVPLMVSAFDEIHQFWLPGRMPGLGDWFAGVCGVALAAIFFRQSKPA